MYTAVMRHSILIDAYTACTARHSCHSVPLIYFMVDLKRKKPKEEIVRYSAESCARCGSLHCSFIIPLPTLAAAVPRSCWFRVFRLRKLGITARTAPRWLAISVRYRFNPQPLIYAKPKIAFQTLTHLCLHRSHEPRYLGMPILTMGRTVAKVTAKKE